MKIRDRFVKIKATIYYMVDTDHPDYKYINGPKSQQQFSDTYTFDTLYWGNDFGSMEARMKQDLALVAGGGYNTDHINHVKYKIIRLN